MTQKSGFKIKHISEIEDHKPEPMKHCRLNAEHGVIEIYAYGGNNTYDIDVMRLRSPGDILDFIFQVKHKTWCGPQMMYELLTCFDMASELYLGGSVQGRFCPGGSNRVIDWEKTEINWELNLNTKGNNNDTKNKEGNGTHKV
jgi:hypothetical protein